MTNRNTFAFVTSLVCLGCATTALGVLALPSLKPGPALPWHASVSVSPFSSVNTFNGNIFTAIPIVSWGGLGHGVSFNLYHNSANLDQTHEDTRNVGFFLGAGWSTSYSDQLILTNPAKVIWANGLVTTFGQAGFYDTLEHDSLDPKIWRVRHKDQSYHEFEVFGDDIVRLIGIVDSAGYRTTIAYQEYEFEEEARWHIASVTGAGRVLEFVYDSIEVEPGVRLVAVESPGIVDLPYEGISTSDRTWEFEYVAEEGHPEWLEFVVDPLENRIHVSYDTECVEYSPDPEVGCIDYDQLGRLATISDWYNSSFTNYTTAKAYIHTYYALGTPAGKAFRVCDPVCGSCGNGTTCSNQRFTYAVNSTGYITTKYYDRRGSEWRYVFNNSEQNIYPDGNLNDFFDPLGSTLNFYYDSDRNAIFITDYIAGYWERDFDAEGNLTYVEDPLTNARSWTYDEYNNVTSYTDPVGNITRLYYDEAHEQFLGACDNVVGVACLLRCDGGDNDDDTCSWDGDCPGGTCEPQNSGCKLCLGGANEGLACTGSGDCPGSTCNQGSCDLYETDPWLPTLLTRIVEPGPSGNPPSGQDPGEEGTYPVTRLNYHLSPTQSCDEIDNERYDCHGMLKEIIDPNQVWTGFEYDRWGQPARYTEGKYESSVATTLLGDMCGPTLDSNGCGRRGGNDAGTCNARTCDANGNTLSNEESDDCDSILAGFFLTGTPFVPDGFPIRPCDAPALPKLKSKFTGASYSPRGELLELPLQVDPEDNDTFTSRTFENRFDYDVPKLEESKVSSKEFNGTNFVPRAFVHDKSWTGGTYLRTGPDGVETYIEFDTANQISCVRRGPTTGDGPLMEAEFSYVQSGMIDTIAYGNEVTVDYDYDYANRLTDIVYQDDSEGLLLSLEYTYTADNLPETITETWPSSVSAETTYTYDNRRRLTREVRTGNFEEYDIEYEYDAGGNRTVKTERDDEEEIVRRTDYFYDIDSTQHGVEISPIMFKSNYNRLQYYEVYEIVDESESLFSTTWYMYSDDDATTWGNPKRIVTEYEADPGVYHAIRFGYAFDNRTVSYVVGETWLETSPGSCPGIAEGQDYAILWAREFRYDSGRARYLSRELDAEDLMAGTITPVSQVWTDYDGDTSYSDYSLSGSPPTATQLKSYEPGLGQVESGADDGDDDTKYYLTDHLGNVRAWSNTTQFMVSPAVYTAFGERISGDNRRYGYVGSHGYQAHNIDEVSELDPPLEPSEVFSFLHVGSRYYDPSTGRFLQRDPIGIRGGTNSYSYVLSQPTGLIDPSGLAAIVVPPPDYPRPPGYDPFTWDWIPNKNPKPKPPQDPGHYRDPNWNKWRYHPEDNDHNPHWDKTDPKGNSEWVPINDKSPIKPKDPPFLNRLLDALWREIICE